MHKLGGIEEKIFKHAIAKHIILFLPYLTE